MLRIQSDEWREATGARCLLEREPPPPGGPESAVWPGCFLECALNVKGSERAPVGLACRGSGLGSGKALVQPVQLAVGPGSDLLDGSLLFLSLHLPLGLKSALEPS
jgi:hypothetical protein